LLVGVLLASLGGSLFGFDTAVISGTTDALRAKFAATGALDADRVITYCGGGIAASSDAFVLTLLGHEGVALYDASLSEWANDPALPMERD